MNSFSRIFVGITFITHTLYPMQNNFSIALFATTNITNPDKKEISLENYNTYCIPLVIPCNAQNPLYFEGYYSQTPYVASYSEKCKVTPSLSIESEDIQYSQTNKPLTILELNQQIQEYVTSKVTIKDTAVKLPIAKNEGERVYVLIKKGRLFLQEFLDTEQVDPEKSLLNYEPTKSFLTYLSNNDGNKKQQNITAVQCFNTPMKPQQLSMFKNHIVTMIHKKFETIQGKNN